MYDRFKCRCWLLRMSSFTFHFPLFPDDTYRYQGQAAHWGAENWRQNIENNVKILRKIYILHSNPFADPHRFPFNVKTDPSIFVYRANVGQKNKSWT